MVLNDPIPLVQIPNGRSREYEPKTGNLDICYPPWTGKWISKPDKDKSALSNMHLINRPLLCHRSPSALKFQRT